MTRSIPALPWLLPLLLLGVVGPAQAGDSATTAEDRPAAWNEASSPHFVCGQQVGVQGGGLDVSDEWRWVATAPVLETVSPVLGMRCSAPPANHLVEAGITLSPWTIHFQDERLIREWMAGSLSLNLRAGPTSFGLIGLAGSGGIGGGLRLTASLLHGPKGNPSGLELRVLTWPLDPDNVHVVLLWNLAARQVKR